MKRTVDAKSSSHAGRKPKITSQSTRPKGESMIGEMNTNRKMNWGVCKRLTVDNWVYRSTLHKHMKRSGYSKNPLTCPDWSLRNCTIEQDSWFPVFRKKNIPKPSITHYEAAVVLSELAAFPRTSEVILDQNSVDFNDFIVRIRPLLLLISPRLISFSRHPFHLPFHSTRLPSIHPSVQGQH